MTSHGVGRWRPCARTIPKRGHGYEESSSFSMPRWRATAHALGGTVIPLWQSTQTKTVVVGRSVHKFHPAPTEGTDWYCRTQVRGLTAHGHLKYAKS